MQNTSKETKTVIPVKTFEKPDYKRIYNDIITLKYPGKREKCEQILKKTDISVLDVIALNKIIFETKDQEALSLNQQHRSYDKKSISEILEYQKKQNFTNLQLSAHFKISRTTIARWKKLYEEN
ncbi:hypothetical protein HNP38_002137 [Chryseobacterium defluvii]|uniref:Uncharacterized protein n=1 Tax=Chryseobacterium defluvii TaxID=160396 RepID=A0A840KBQ1_9FLAO|nr:helix-turn-helix domain-containing protein [Chryseobacterium defluvii]MBB4806841.1 hypothetical protein [Chryseobacterium defluvii]